MTIPESIVAASITAATAVIAALTTWALSWIGRKVRENEEANRSISDETRANGGRIDAVHTLLNGGQIQSLIDMTTSNAESLKRLLDLVRASQPNRRHDDVPAAPDPIPPTETTTHHAN